MIASDVRIIGQGGDLEREVCLWKALRVRRRIWGGEKKLVWDRKRERARKCEEILHISARAPQGAKFVED